jgi:hypothetical protein
MNLLEEAVLEYVTHKGDVFVCPQYEAPGGKPDFVALNFTKHQVEVIEVKGAYNLAGLRRKLQQTAWVDAVVKELKETKAIDGNWKLVLRAFVAAAYKKQLEGKKYPHETEVETVDRVFECLLDWRKWEDRVPKSSS